MWSVSFYKTFCFPENLYLNCKSCFTVILQFNSLHRHCPTISYGINFICAGLKKGLKVLNLSLKIQQQPCLTLRSCIHTRRGLQEKPPSSPPTHYHEQLCECSGVIQVPGNHHLSGPEVGHSHRLHCEKGPAENVLSRQLKSSTCTGAHDTVLLCCYWVGSVLFYNCMVWVSQQIRNKKTCSGLLGQQKGSLVCTCPAFRICTTPEWRNRQVTSSQIPLTLDTTCLRFSLQAEATDLLCTRTSRHKNSFFPYANLQPKPLNTEYYLCSVILEPQFCL